MASLDKKSDTYHEPMVTLRGKGQAGRKRTGTKTRSASPKKSAKVNADQGIHIAVRIRSDDGRTVSAHRNVIDERGSVLSAKLAKGLGHQFQKQLN